MSPAAGDQITVAPSSQTAPGSDTSRSAATKSSMRA